MCPPLWSPTCWQFVSHLRRISGCSGDDRMSLSEPITTVAIGVSVRTWAPSQYPKRRLSVRSRKVSKPRDFYLELSDRSEIWQALRQQCCRCACQISKRYDNLKYQSSGFETLRDLMKRRLFGYWDGALHLASSLNKVSSNCKFKIVCPRWRICPMICGQIQVSITDGERHICNNINYIKGSRVMFPYANTKLEMKYFEKVKYTKMMFSFKMEQKKFIFSLYHMPCALPYSTDLTFCHWVRPATIWKP